MRYCKEVSSNIISSLIFVFLLLTDFKEGEIKVVVDDHELSKKQPHNFFHLKMAMQQGRSLKGASKKLDG